VNRPQVLLADEPTGNLDDGTATQVLDLLGDVHRSTGCTLVIVTHDRRVADRADAVRGLSMGRWVPG
jgi:putative ABC transport system ATP-binding protein